MAFTTVIMENPQTGAQKPAPVGLSWTVLFFGFLPPLFRGDIKWGLIILAFWLFSAGLTNICLLYTSPSPRDQRGSRMPSSA